MKRTDLFHVMFSDIVVEEGFNVRYDYGDIEELTDSVIENGVKVPVRGAKNKEGKYVLTDGHRRYTAVKNAIENRKVKEESLLIPLIPDGKASTEEDRILGMIIYNDGKKLTLLEEAEVYKRLEATMSQADISRKVGKTPTHVSNLIKLANTSDKVKKQIKDGKVSASLIIEELKLKSEDAVVASVDAAHKASGGKQVSKKHLANPKEQAIGFLAAKGGEKIETILVKVGGKFLNLVELLVDFKKLK